MIKTIEQWICDLCGESAKAKNGEPEDGQPMYGSWKEFTFCEKKGDVTYVETHHLCGKCIDQLVKNKIATHVIPA